MYKNSIPEVPELAQIVKFASFLDSIGENSDAEVLDEYIKKAATYSDFEILKQAGLWGNIWKRLKGSVKKMFISEYRELYDEAKRSQVKLEERISKIREEGKVVKESFKNYDFGEWRVNIAKLQVQGLQTSDIMQGFEAKYAKFINYVAEHYKDDESELSPDFKAMVGKTKVNEKEEMALANFFKGLDLKNRSWLASDGQNKSIQVYVHDTNIIRFEKSKFDAWDSERHFVTVSGEPDVICMNTEKVIMKDKGGKQKERERPENLKKALSNFKWKEIGLYEGFVYFKKDGQLSEEDLLVEVSPVLENADPSKIPSDAPSVDVPKVQLDTPLVPSETQPIGGLGEPLHGVKPQEEEEKLEPLSNRVVQEKPDVTKIMEPSDKEDPIVEEESQKLVTPEVSKQLQDMGLGKKELINTDVANEKDLKELLDVKKIKQPLPITGIPIGTHWVQYKDGGYFGPVKTFDPKRHKIVTEEASRQILDAKWAAMENEARKKEMEAAEKEVSQTTTAILQRKNKIISLSQQLDVSTRKQRILELLNK